MISQNIGGPGIGLHPGNLDVPCIWRGTGTLLAGQVAQLDFAATDGDVDTGVGPGPDNSPFANLILPPVGVANGRRGIFAVALVDIATDTLGLFRFSGVMGTTATAQAAETNPDDGVFVIASSGNAAAGQGLFIDGNSNNLQPDALAAGTEYNQKVIAINLILQTTPTTAQKTAVWFDGIHGFGTIGAET